MLKKIFAMLLAIITVFSCVVFPASASTSSYGTYTRTITVVTKANWAYPGSESITISQSKGTFSYSKTDWLGRATGRTATRSEYGSWNISVCSTDGSHRFSRSLTGGSIKLNLRPNKTYKITISYDGYQETIRGIKYCNLRWTRYPSWRVSGTWKVSSFW